LRPSAELSIADSPQHQRGSFWSDWSQTLRIIREPHTRHEGNPVLGRHPSEGRVNTMIGLAVTANLAALLLPKQPRRIWYAAVILVEGIAVTHNVMSGLSIGF